MFPAAVKAGALGWVEFPPVGAAPPEGALEPPEPPALGMAVSAGPEHDTLGADVRVTNWLVEVVVGHDSQMAVEPVAFSVAAHVYAWKAPEDVSSCHKGLGA